MSDPISLRLNGSAKSPEFNEKWEEAREKAWDRLEGRFYDEVTRETVWNWITDDMFPRLSENAGLIMIMTRWHARTGREALCLRHPARLDLPFAI